MSELIIAAPLFPVPDVPSSIPLPSEMVNSLAFKNKAPPLPAEMLSISCSSGIIYSVNVSISLTSVSKTFSASMKTAPPSPVFVALLDILDSPVSSRKSVSIESIPASPAPVALTSILDSSDNSILPILISTSGPSPVANCHVSSPDTSKASHPPVDLFSVA